MNEHWVQEKTSEAISVKKKNSSIFIRYFYKALLRTFVVVEKK